jgi:iron complex transport system ATP-binding protein
MLVADQLVIGYGARRVAGPLSMQLPAGEFACLLGPNGAGKSTLLRTLGGMQSALSGRVIESDVDLSRLSARERAQRIAVVLTDRTSTGLLSAYELVALGRLPHTGWNGRLGPQDHAAVDSALRAVGSIDFAQRLVADLSDGERQRIWLARALAQEPRALLLDEVLAFLDLPRRVQIMRLLRRIARERSIAVLLSCHDLELALRDADRLWLMMPNGTVRIGNADELSNDGSLNEAFANEGVRYDAAERRFYAREDQTA